MQGGGGRPSDAVPDPGQSGQGTSRPHVVCLSQSDGRVGLLTCRGAHLLRCSPVGSPAHWARGDGMVTPYWLLVDVLRKGLRRCYTPGLAKVHRFVSSNPALPTSVCRGGRACVGLSGELWPPPHPSCDAVMGSFALYVEIAKSDSPARAERRRLPRDQGPC